MPNYEIFGEVPGGLKSFDRRVVAMGNGDGIPAAQALAREGARDSKAHVEPKVVRDHRKGFATPKVLQGYGRI